MHVSTNTLTASRACAPCQSCLLPPRSGPLCPLQARNFLAPDELFKGEVEETIDKVRKAAKVLHAFTELYEDHRQKLKTYFKEGGTVREWEFAPELVFARYDLFVQRVETVEVRY